MDNDKKLIRKSIYESQFMSPQNAIILAAGCGFRMIPINHISPKALLDIKGEVLIERIIKQLHEINITNIVIVVGFMKEKFDYLIDKYGVELVENPNYATKNSISSLELVVDRISNTYIIPSDIWCEENPFNYDELNSWYMVSDMVDDESNLFVNEKMELIKVNNGSGGNRRIGISFLSKKDALKICECISNITIIGDECWEILLFKDDRMIIPAKIIKSSSIFEINTYEELRKLDSKSKALKSEALSVIEDVFSVNLDEIKNICAVKTGMTNRSFFFTIRNEKYIMRIPGEGTDKFINREHEANVFKVIEGLGICDNPVYINPKNGYKITKFLKGIRTCNCGDIFDLERCMKKLREFHNMKLKVNHTFNLFDQIEFYESLWSNKFSLLKDYHQTKINVLKLKSFIDSLDKEWCLTHIDAVSDNFLFFKLDEKSEELIQLTDWEYAGMQDPHVDIAMFCIYSGYSKDQVDKLIDIYFENQCSISTRIKIYAYISICGLLWFNWCEFKRSCGVDFGEYSLSQYRFAKDYYQYTIAGIEGIKE